MYYSSARVCKNPMWNPMYLDQIEDRNAVEKLQYKDLFDDYSKLMDDFADLEKKVRSGQLMGNSIPNISFMQGGVTNSSTFINQSGFGLQDDDLDASVSIKPNASKKEIQLKE